MKSNLICVSLILELLLVTSQPLNATSPRQTEIETPTFPNRTHTLVRSANENSTSYCSESASVTVLKCFTDFIAVYGFSLDQNSKLPPARSSLFTQIMLDSSEICRYYESLRTCMGNTFEECVNYKTLERFTVSPIDAGYYISQLAYFELYCMDPINFIDYFQCYGRIDEDSELSNEYRECFNEDVQTCRSVSNSMLCQKNIFNAHCGKRDSKAFCAYSSIELRMYGWKECKEMTCYSGQIKTITLLINAIIIYSLW